MTGKTKTGETDFEDDLSLAEEELEVEDLESVLTQNENDDIGSSAEEKQSPIQLLLEKGKKED